MALPEAHPAATRPHRQHLRLVDVAAEPLVIFPRQIAPSLFDAVLSAYRAQGATPHIGQEAIQMQTIVNLVSAGMGVAWVPESVTRLQRPGVVYRPVADAGLRCETSLIWREPAAPVVQRFVEQVRLLATEPAAALRRQSRVDGPPSGPPGSESS